MGSLKDFKLGTFFLKKVDENIPIKTTYCEGCFFTNTNEDCTIIQTLYRDKMKNDMLYSQIGCSINYENYIFVRSLSKLLKKL